MGQLTSSNTNHKRMQNASHTFRTSASWFPKASKSIGKKEFNWDVSSSGGSLLTSCQGTNNVSREWQTGWSRRKTWNINGTPAPLGRTLMQAKYITQIRESSIRSVLVTHLRFSKTSAFFHQQSPQSWTCQFQGKSSHKWRRIMSNKQNTLVRQLMQVTKVFSFSDSKRGTTTCFKNKDSPVVNTLIDRKD